MPYIRASIASCALMFCLDASEGPFAKSIKNYGTRNYGSLVNAPSAKAPFVASQTTYSHPDTTVATQEAKTSMYEKLTLLLFQKPLSHLATRSHNSER